MLKVDYASVPPTPELGRRSSPHLARSTSVLSSSLAGQEGTAGEASSTDELADSRKT